MSGYEGKPWLLRFHNILFDLFNEKYELVELETDDIMCFSVAYTLGRLDYVSDLSDQKIMEDFLHHHLGDIQDAKRSFADLILKWQGNNWRRLHVSL